jgi:hypothetical protein
LAKHDQVHDSENHERKDSGTGEATETNSWSHHGLTAEDPDQDREQAENGESAVGDADGVHEKPRAVGDFIVGNSQRELSQIIQSEELANDIEDRNQGSG